MQPEIILTRINRFVTVTGPKGNPPASSAIAALDAAMTYYERKFNYQVNNEYANRLDIQQKKLLTRVPNTGEPAFPLGLRPRAVNVLTENGYKVTYRSHPMVAANSPACDLDWNGLFSEFSIFSGQDECLSRIIGSEGGVIAASTGYGKSVLIRMICRLYHKAKIHVVTKARTLADEIYNDLIKVIPNVGIVGNGKRRPDRVTVFVADSLHHGMGDADIVLADEGHELVAPSYAESLGRYTKARMFTFSATPKGRMDGRDMILEAIFGPTLYEMPYQEAQAAGRVVPITVEWLRANSGPDVSFCRGLVAKERVGIWRNDIRNKLIADRVNKFEDDEQVLIMVKTIDHAVRLKQFLPDFTLCYAAGGLKERKRDYFIRNGLLNKDEPEMSKARTRELRNQFAAGTLKKVIANYVWSTGVNFRSLGVLVRADAAASEIRDGQIPGRICRRIPGVKESALLIDVWDNWETGFCKRSQTRKTNYTKKGWKSNWSGEDAST